jgi:hypothetical protein
MDIAPEYMLAGVILVLMVIVVAVVAVIASLFIIQPDFPGILSFLASTTTSSTTTTTTTSTSTTTSTESTTTTESTSTTTTTTLAPFYICEKSISESFMVPTQCQSKPPAGAVNAKPGPWYDSKIKATVTYNITNAIEDYDFSNSKVSGDKCRYLISKSPNGKFCTDFISCVIPNNLSTVRDAQLIKP